MSSRRVLLVVTVLSALIATLVFHIVSGSVQIQKIDLLIDAKIQTGSLIEVYINADYQHPYTTPIVANAWRHYELPNIQGPIKDLRIDLGKADGGAVSIASISLAVDHGPTRQLAPEEIAKIIGPQAEAVAANPTLDPTAISYVQRGEGPKITMSDPFGAEPAGVNSPILTRWLGGFGSRNDVVDLLAISVALIVLVNVTAPAIAAAGILSLVSIGCVFVIVWAAIRWIKIPDLVSHSVGRAAFIGGSTLANQVAVVLCLLAAVGLGLIGLARRRLRSSAAFAPEEQSLPGRWRALVALAVYLWLVTFFLVNVFPNIVAEGTSFLTPNWDGNNVLLWQYLIHEGYVPLKDFWFPYGGTWAFALPAPWGEIWEWGDHGLVYANLFIALHLLFGRRIIAPLAMVSLVMIGEQSQIFWASWRYLLAIDITLAVIAWSLRPNWKRWPVGLLPVTVLLAAFMEPIQVGYASPAIIVAFLFTLPRSMDGFPEAFIRHAIRLFLPTVVVLVPFLALSFFTGDLARQWAFYSSLGPHTIGSSLPTDLGAALDLRADPASVIVLFGPFVMVTIGLFRCLREGRAQMETLCLLGLGLTGFMFLQKHIVRENQWMFLLSTGLGTLIWLYAEPGLQRCRSAMIAGGCLAMLWLVPEIRSDALAYANGMAHAPVEAAKGLVRLITNPATITQANGFAYSRARFRAYTDELAVVGRIDDLTKGHPAAVYVLGDAPEIYILLHQLPPFQSNDYNAAPLPEQNHVISWIDANDPEYVLWRPQDLSFDEVPRVLRDPLIYGRIVRDFVPFETSGSFELLRRRAPGEPVALAWWRDRLTPVIDMGHILSNTGTMRLAPCDVSNEASCEPELIADVSPQAPPPAVLAIPISLGGLSFTVKIATTAGQARYIVPLERLWPFAAGNVLGLPPSVGKLDSPGVSVSIEGRTRDPRILY